MSFTSVIFLKFFFVDLSNQDIQKDSFNLLFQCKCQTVLPTGTGNNEFVNY